MRFLLLNVVVAVLLCRALFSVPLHAGSATFNFNDNQLPPNDVLRGGSGITANGRLELTPANYYQSASFIIHDLDPGAKVTSFSATFNVQIGPGTTPPADGIAFAFGPLATLRQAFDEDGLVLPNVRGLSITFDTFNNGNDFTGIEVYYGPTRVFLSDGQGGRPLITENQLVTGNFVPITVTFDSTGLSMTRNGVPVFSHLDLNGAEPGVGAFQNGDQFGFGARTGGYNEAHYIDDIQIVTSATIDGPPSRTDITRPGDAIVIAGGGTTPVNEEVVNAINNRDGSKYLNFNGAGTGLRVTPSNGATIVTGLSLTSANDAPERDPTSFQLFGSNNGVNFTLIASGPISSFPNRFEQRIIDFANATAFTTYQLIFPTINGGPFMQIGEIGLLGIPGSNVPPTTSFRGLGFLNGATSSSASGISADGRVVVGESPSSPTPRAFRFIVNSGAILGLDSANVFGSARAEAVSDDGSVIVGTISNNSAFVWTSPNGIRVLDLYDASAAQAHGVSGDGRTIVGSAKDTRGSGLDHPYFWGRDSSGSYVPDYLPNVWGTSGLALGSALSAAGSNAPNSQLTIVGYHQTEFGIEAMTFYPDDGYTYSVHSNYAAFISTRAFGTTASGQVVVGEATNWAGSTLEAFRWTPNTGSVGLGDLPNGTFGSHAADVSRDGTQVVGYGTTLLGNEAFIWDPGTGMRNLRELLISRGANLAGWVLTNATGISDDGFTIVGTGINPSGKTEAWIAVLPAQPVITNADRLGRPVPGQPFSFKIEATKQPTSYGVSNLPLGLQFNSASGEITGVVPPPGTYLIGLSATNAVGTGTATLPLIVGVPTISSPLVAAASVEVPFTYQITADKQPYSYQVSGLPAGLRLSGFNQITGIPEQSGRFSVTLTALNIVGGGVATLDLTVGPPALGFLSDATASGKVGQPFSYTLIASENPQSFDAVGLPSGLQINPATGVISGTPLQSGIFDVTLLATNNVATGRFSLAIAIAPPNPTVDPVNPENSLGHGLIVTDVSGFADWYSGTTSNQIVVKNPSRNPSFEGEIRIVRYRDSGPPVVRGVFHLPSIPAGQEREISVSGDLGISGATPKKSRLYAAVYESVGASSILQTSALLAYFYDYPTGPPTGGDGSGNPDDHPGDLDPLRLERVSVHGPATVKERSQGAGQFTARAHLSDGTTLDQQPTQWASTKFNITATGGLLSTGPVSADTSAGITAEVEVAGVTKKSPPKVITIIDMTPHVSITAPDPLAQEEVAGDKARFVVQRDKSSDSPLTVYYTVTSNSTAGPDDYEPLPGTVTIAANQLTAEITLTAKDDNLIEVPDETVELSVAGSHESEDTYQAVASSTAAIAIHGAQPENFNTWRQRKFSPAQLNDITVSGLLADPDGDKIGNLLEFALNLDPGTAGTPLMSAGTGTAGLPLIRLEQIQGEQRLTAEYVRRRGAALSGITYWLEFSSDLTKPTEWSVSPTESVSIIDEVWERVKVVDSVPAPARRFGRLRVSQP